MNEGLPPEGRRTVLRIVVMGVSGCGKSTVGAALAARLGLPFIEGDALHDPASVAKMAAGAPLCDADRWPWLDRIGAALATPPDGAVAACSALRRAYRDRLRAAVPGLAFLHLTGDRATIAARMATRPHHFMPPALIDSQFATLEPPEAESDVLTLPVTLPVDEITTRAAAALAGGVAGRDGTAAAG
jgi:carbohydrate kinase (thermoresistant glucokinase family)